MQLSFRFLDEPIQNPDHSGANRPGMALILVLPAIDDHREVPKLLRLPILRVLVVAIDNAVALIVLD